jgi:hypothetical protein
MVFGAIRCVPGSLPSDWRMRAAEKTSSTGSGGKFTPPVAGVGVFVRFFFSLPRVTLIGMYLCRKSVLFLLLLFKHVVLEIFQLSRGRSFVSYDLQCMTVRWLDFCCATSPLPCP